MIRFGMIIALRNCLDSGNITREGGSRKMQTHNTSVETYRSRLQRQGIKRVEIRIPSQDAPLARDIADVLRSGGRKAFLLRERIKELSHGKNVASGSDLVAFFRNSPLKDVSLDLKRAKETSRTVCFE